MKKKISIVVPCYNEQENVADMYNAIKSEMAKLEEDYTYENVFIDNDSADNTVKILKEIAAKDKRVKVIVNNRNFGPEVSSFYALLQTSGDAVISICCDMQEPPAMIPDFIKEWEKGFPVVWGQNGGCKEGWFMRSCRSLYYKIIEMLSPIKQYKHITGFGLLDRKVIEQLRPLDDPWPMVRNIIPDLGYTPKLLPFQQLPRQKGTSSYTFFKYFDTALNSLTHTSKVPLKIAIYLGFICGVLSFMAGCFYLFAKLFFWESFSFGLAPILIGVFFIMSVQIFFLGLLGEYLLAVLDRVSFRHYVIEKERINF